MPFIKTGDISPITDCYELDKSHFCEKCGKKKKIYVDEDHNELVCEFCDVKEDNNE